MDVNFAGASGHGVVFSQAIYLEIEEDRNVIPDLELNQDRCFFDQEAAFLVAAILAGGQKVERGETRHLKVLKSASSKHVRRWSILFLIEVHFPIERVIKIDAVTDVGILLKLIHPVLERR